VNEFDETINVNSHVSVTRRRRRS